MVDRFVVVDGVEYVVFVATDVRSLIVVMFGTTVVATSAFSGAFAIVKGSWCAMVDVRSWRDEGRDGYWSVQE